MAMAIAKCVLVVVNIFITILGLAFLGGGLFALFGGMIEKEVDKVLDAIPDLPEKFNLQDSNTDMEQASLDFNKLIGNIAIGACVAGAVLFLIGIFGCCGVCCKSRTLLILYIVVVVFFIIVQVGVAVIIYTGKFNKEIKKTMKSTITDNFVAIDSIDPDSVLWNVIQLYFGCCGIDGVNDYLEAKKWDRNRTVEVQPNQNEEVYLETPFSCCKVQGKFPDVQPVEQECAIQPSAANSNKDIGCYEKIKDKARPYQIYIIAGAGGGIGLQILILIAAIVVCHSLHRQNRTARINY